MDMRLPGSGYGDGTFDMSRITWSVLTRLQEEGKVGDQFMNQVQEMATQVPYMVSPGNHEWL